MSKRLISSSGNLTFVIAAIALLLYSAANSTLLAYSSGTVVKIEKTRSTFQGQFEYIDISMENQAGQPSFSAFNLTIKYDPAVLTFFSISPGPWFNNCNWELYDYQASNGIIRIQVVADLNNGNFHPSCNLGQYSDNLGTIEFLVSNNSQYECQFSAVDFYWDSCGANTFVSANGDTSYVANNVYPFDESFGPYPTPDTLNTTHGLPQSCLAGMIQGRPPVRLVDFQNGAVDIVCTDSIDARGDLNLNGIPNEIADYVLYEFYFLYGIDALNSHPPFRLAQIAASDVNADGRQLEFSDLVYLWRVIQGDALPFPKRPAKDTLTAAFYQDLNAKTVGVHYSSTLAGAALVFSGSIVPTPMMPNTFMSYSDTVGTTRVLFPPDANIDYSEGVWFTYTGNGTLQNVLTGDRHDNLILTTVSYIGIIAGCGDVNASNTINISDAVYLIAYIFGGGGAPQDTKHGDVNCDNTCNISDAVSLMNFIFAGGSAPCQSCP